MKKYALVNVTNYSRRYTLLEVSLENGINEFTVHQIKQDLEKEFNLIIAIVDINKFSSHAILRDTTVFNDDELNERALIKSFVKTIAYQTINKSAIKEHLNKIFGVDGLCVYVKPYDIKTMVLELIKEVNLIKEIKNKLTTEVNTLNSHDHAYTLWSIYRHLKGKK